MDVFEVLKRKFFLTVSESTENGKRERVERTDTCGHLTSLGAAPGRQHDPNSGERAWSLSTKTLRTWTFVPRLLDKEEVEPTP